MRTLSVAVRFFTDAFVICTLQPATSTTDLTSTFLPFWPLIVAISGSGDAHRSAVADRAEFDAAAGSASWNDLIGTSGTVSKVDVIPFDRLSLPLRSTV